MMGKETIKNGNFLEVEFQNPRLRNNSLDSALVQHHNQLCLIRALSNSTGRALCHCQPKDQP